MTPWMAGFRIRNVQAGKEMTESAAEAIGVLVIFVTMALLTAVVGSIRLAGTMS